MNIIVTGASSGIGKEIALLLARGGHRVAALARSKEALDELARAQGDSNITAYVLDVGGKEAVRTTIDDISIRFGNIDAAICAAGVFPDDIHPDFDIEAFTEAIRTNLFGVMNVVSSLLPYFTKRKNGTVVAVGSMAMYRGSVRGIGYPASKAALAAAMKSLDLRYRSQGVRFHTAILGPITTKMWEGKVSFLTPAPAAAARHIISQLAARSGISYFPKFTTTMYRLSLILPDRLFVYLSQKLLK